MKLDDNQKKALKKVAELLEKDFKDDKELHDDMYSIIQECNLEPGDFFKAAYLVLVNKEKGPRLAHFILTIGKDKVKNLFERV